MPAGCDFGDLPDPCNEIDGGQDLVCRPGAEGFTCGEEKRTCGPNLWGVACAFVLRTIRRETAAALSVSPDDIGMKRIERHCG